MPEFECEILTPYRRFYEGNADYSAHIPWELWARPLIAWGALVLTSYFTLLCLNGVFRRRWFDQEHITYPLADLAQAVAGASTSASSTPTGVAGATVTLAAGGQTFNLSDSGGGNYLLSSATTARRS